MEAQFAFHHRRGFSWRGRAIFKNRGNLTCHGRLRSMRAAPIFDHPNPRLNLSVEPRNPIDDEAFYGFDQDKLAANSVVNVAGTPVSVLTVALSRSAVVRNPSHKLTLVKRFPKPW